MHSTRRRRMTSSSLSSSVHRRARSLGGVLLGEGAISPVGGPDGVDPNLVAAIESGSSSIPLPVPIPATSASHRSGSVSSSGTQGAGSSLSSSGVASSSVPFSSPMATRSLHRRRDSQVIEDDEMPRPEGPGLTPSPHSRSRVRSQTLLVPPSAGTPAQMAATDSYPSSTGPSPLGKSSSSAGLADAIRLQRVPTAVRLAGDLFVPPSPSPRTMPKSASTMSIESPLSRWTASGVNAAQQASPLAMGGEQPGTRSWLGLSADAVPSPSPAPISRLNVPQTPNATRSNSPLASEYSSGAEDQTASGRNSPARERLRAEDLAMPGHDTYGHPLSVSIPIGRNYAPTASLPSSALLGSRSPTVAPAKADLLDVPTSAPRQAGLPASSSAYSPLLALGTSSAQTSPIAERRPRLSPSRSATQRMSWGAQELFDSLAEPRDGAQRQQEQSGTLAVGEDKPAPWIASTQDAPVRAPLAPAATAASSLSQRRMTQGNLSSSIGSNALLAIPSSSRRTHRPSDAALFPPSSVTPASGQPLSGTDEYAPSLFRAEMQRCKSGEHRTLRDSVHRPLWNPHGRVVSDPVRYRPTACKH